MNIAQYYSWTPESQTARAAVASWPPNFSESGGTVHNPKPVSSDRDRSCPVVAIGGIAGYTTNEDLLTKNQTLWAIDRLTRYMVRTVCTRQHDLYSTVLQMIGVLETNLVCALLYNEYPSYFAFLRQISFANQVGS